MDEALADVKIPDLCRAHPPSFPGFGHYGGLRRQVIRIDVPGFALPVAFEAGPVYLWITVKW